MSPDSRRSPQSILQLQNPLPHFLNIQIFFPQLIFSSARGQFLFKRETTAAARGLFQLADLHFEIPDGLGILHTVYLGVFLHVLDFLFEIGFFSDELLDLRLLFSEFFVVESFDAEALRVLRALNVVCRCSELD